MRRPVVSVATVGLLVIASVASAQDRPEEEPSETPAFTEGNRIELDLGTARVNWNKSAWKVADYQPAKNQVGVTLTVSTDEPRRDVGVALAVGEADGSWYYLPWAIDLTQTQQSKDVYFEDFVPAFWVAPVGSGKFVDENGFLDVDQIDKVAIGTVNPFGVGKVSFKLEMMERNVLGDEPPEPSPAVISVSGDLLSVNGHSMVPPGVFGSFNLGSITVDGKKVPRWKHFRLGMDRRIDHDGRGHGVATNKPDLPIMLNTLGDRVRPSHRLTDAKWEEKYLAQGEAIGKKAKEAEGQIYVELWNEPYLNWANRNRAGFIPRYFDESKAKEGGEVRIKHDGTVVPHLRWTKKYDAPPWNWTSEKDWRKGRTADGKVLSPASAPPYSGMDFAYGGPWRPQFHPPVDVKDGETFTVKHQGKEIELTAFTPWHVYDETQFTYWSGKGMLPFYVEPMDALARGIAKAKAHDHVFFIAGWGFRPSEDHWAAWNMLYKPTIDAAAEYIDAFCDHDYGSSPQQMLGVYETVTAYGATRHGRWIYGFNTETASATDPQANAAAGGEGGSDSLKFRWFSEKVLAILMHQPGKVKALAHFGLGGPWWSDTGEGKAATLLKGLRGRLMNIEAKHADGLLYVASIDGTDASLPGTAFGEDDERDHLVVAVFNPTPTARPIRLGVNAPKGHKILDGSIAIQDPDAASSTTVAFDAPPVAPEDREAFENDPGWASYSDELTIPAGGLLVGTFELNKPLASDAKPTRFRQQQFATNLLDEVTPTAPATLAFKLPTKDKHRIESIHLRLSTERLGRGEATVSFGKQSIPLPGVPNTDNGCGMVDIALPKDAIDWIVGGGGLTLTVEKGQQGFLLCSASIVVDSTVELAIEQPRVKPSDADLRPAPVK